MKLFATISFGEGAWQHAMSVTGTKHQIVDHLFWLARTNDRSDGIVEYVLEDTMDDPYNPALVIRSTDAFGERDFVVIAFILPAVELTTWTP